MYARKKIVANKLKDFLMNERENAAIEFVKWLDEMLHILPGGMDLEQLYNDFLKIYNPYKPGLKGYDNIQQHKTT